MVGALSSSNPEDDGHLWCGDLESSKGRAADAAAYSAIETAERKVSRVPGERAQHIKGKSTALSEENKERERERDCFDHDDDAQQVCHRCGSNVHTVRKRGTPKFFDNYHRPVCATSSCLDNKKHGDINSA